MIPALIAVGAAVWRGASIASVVAPLVKPAIKFGTGVLRRASARPGIGSKVTKGPLKVGKQTVYGSARPGIGTIARVGVAGGALGVGVASHKVFKAPAKRTQPQPQPRRAPTPRPTSKGTRKCCPEGTRRMVCYKRGRVKPRLGSKASKWKRRSAKTTKRRRK